MTDPTTDHGALPGEGAKKSISSAVRNLQRAVRELEARVDGGPPPAAPAPAPAPDPDPSPAPAPDPAPRPAAADYENDGWFTDEFGDDDDDDDDDDEEDL